MAGAEDPNWRERMPTMAEQQAFMLEHSLRSDCAFRVGPDDLTSQIFLAHKMILARASSVFDAMFFGSLPEKGGEVRVIDLQPATFKVMLSFIYTDTLPPGLEHSDLVALTLAADKYFVPGLRKACVNSVVENMKPADVWSSLQLSEVFEETRLREAALKILGDHAEELLKAPSFLNVPHSTLVSIVQQDYLNVSSEMVVIEACLRWARHECERRDLEVNDSNLRVVMGPEVVASLRLLSLSPHQFASGPGAQDWLSDKEKGFVYQSLLAPSKVSKFQFGLCSGKEPRKEPEVCYPPANFEEFIISLPKKYIEVSSSASLTSVSTNICAEKDSWLVQLQIFTQIDSSMILKTSDFHISGERYQEDMYITVKKAKENIGEWLTVVCFSGTASYNSQVTLTPDKPVLLKKNVAYVLTVNFRKKGCYPLMTSNSLHIRAGTLDCMFSRNVQSSLGIPLKNMTFHST